VRLSVGVRQLGDIFISTVLYYFSVISILNLDLEM